MKSASAKATPPMPTAAIAIPRPNGSVGADRILANETRAPTMPTGAARRLTGGVPTINKRALSEKKQETEAKNDLFRLSTPCVADSAGTPTLTVSTSPTLSYMELKVNKSGASLPGE